MTKWTKAEEELDTLSPDNENAQSLFQTFMKSQTV